MNNVIAKEMLLDFKQIMDDYGVPFWLREGTLLGAVRDNDFITGDKDMDVSALAQDFHPVEHSRLWLMLAEKFTIGIAPYFHPFSGLKLKRSNHHIDVMLQFYNVPRDSYITCSPPYSDRWRTEMPAYQYDEGRAFPFLGTLFHIPKLPRMVLQNIYGDFWETPMLNPHMERKPWMKWRLHWTIYSELPEFLSKGITNPLTK